MGGRRTAGHGAAAAVLAALAAGPAAGAEDCDPAVERALVENAEAGARDDVRIVRHPRMGVRDPDSLFDLSCVTDMFDYRHSNILFSPDRAMSDILGMLRRLVCDRAREAYRGFVGRDLDATAFARDLPRLPGLDVGVTWGNLLDDAKEAARETRPPPSESGAVPPGPQRVDPALPGREEDSGAAPARRPALLRSLLGGETGREDKK